MQQRDQKPPGYLNVENFASDPETLLFSLGSAGIGIWKVDISSNKIIWDSRCRELFGIKTDNILSYDEALQYIHPDDLDGVNTQVQNALNGINLGSYNASFRTIGADDGQLRWVNFIGKAYFDSEGKALNFGGIALDVTARMREQQALKEHDESVNNLLREGQQQLLSAFEQAPVAIGLLSRDQLKFIIANISFCEILGRKPEDVLGLPMLEAVPEASGQGFEQFIYNVINTGKPFSAQEMPARLVRNGELETVYINLSIEPYYEADHSITGVVVAGTDVSFQVKARKAIEESESRLDLLSNAVPAMMFYLDREQRYQSYNQRFMEWFNVDETEVIGKTVREFLGDKAYAAVSPRLDKAYKGEVEEYEMPAPGNLSGAEWLKITYTPHKSLNGQVLGVIVLATDITQSKRSADLIQQSETNLNIAVNLAELGTWSVNAETGEVTFSDQIKSWFGFDGSLPIENAFDSIHPLDRDRIEAGIYQALTAATEGAFDEEYRIVNLKDGKERFIHAFAKTIYSLEGKPLVLQGSARNITIERNIRLQLELDVARQTADLAQGVSDLAESNEALEQSNKELLRSNEELAQYAYIASHDLQEPLRKISMYSSILNNSYEMPKGLTPIVQKIRDNTIRMSSLIRNLLEFSELIKTDKLFTQVDLNKIFEGVKGDYELLIKEKQAVLEIERLPVIEAVSFQMQQLFFNLIGNALKFSKAGAHPSVKIQCEQKGPRVCITISDNGIGFDQGYAEQIFHLFKRLHSRDTYSGTGIGLAICKRIVENHNGKISVESETGQGTKFKIDLPIQQG